MSSILIDHVGPISRLQIPVPDGGGIVVLRGRNGTGKSHALLATQSLGDRAVRKGLPIQDGAKSGQVEGLGVSLRLGRTNRVSGELICEGLDGSCDPSVLVDPGYKDPIVADRHRMATLCRLVGLRVSVAQWGHLFDGTEEFRSLVNLEEFEGQDPLETAERIRRKLHESALSHERKAASAGLEAAAISRSIADVDLTAPSDPVLARTTHTQRVAALHAAGQMRIDADAARARAAQAMQRLAALEVDATPTADLVRAVDLAAADQRQKEADLEVAKIAYDAAKLAVGQVAQELRGASDRLRAHQANAGVIHELRLAIEAASAGTDAPTDETLRAMMAEADAAERAVQQAEVVRRARESACQAESLQAAASRDADTAVRLRELARSTDAILESALADLGIESLRVVEGRLCASTDRSDAEPFGELSHGERWRLALDVAARQIHAGGVLAVRQEAWEGLDPDNRSSLADLARARGLVLITAEADGGELRAEVYEGGDA